MEKQVKKKKVVTPPEADEEIKVEARELFRSVYCEMLTQRKSKAGNMAQMAHDDYLSRFGS